MRNACIQFGTDARFPLISAGLFALLFACAVSVSAERVAPDAEQVQTGVIPRLQLENSDVISVLGIIGSYSGMEIIPSSTVKGCVSMDLSNISWQDALDTLCRKADLMPVTESNYVFVMPRKETKAKPESRANPAFLQKEDLRLRFISKTEAESALAGVLSPKGKLEFSDSARTFTLVDSAEAISRARAELARRETEALQIRLRARLFRLDPKLKESLEWVKPSLVSRFEPSEPLADSLFDPGFRVARLPTDAGEWKSFFGKLEGKLLAESTLTLAGSRECSGFLGEPLSVQIVDSHGKRTVRVLDPGLKFLVSPKYQDDSKIALELEMERRAYLLDPNIGVVPDHAKAEFSIATEENTPVLVGSFCGDFDSDLALILLPTGLAP